MARTFNGTSDNISCGNPSALDPSFPWTVAALVYINNLPTLNNYKIISRALTTGLKGWSFGVVGPGGSLGHLIFSKYGVADITSGAATTVSAGKWYLLACYVSATTAHFYMLDIAADSAATSDISNSQAFIAGADNLHIGNENASSAGNVRFFDGDIAIAGVWNAAPTDDQLRDLAYDLDAWYWKQPVALWQFDQGSTSQALYDAIQNAPQAAISGTSVSARSAPIWTPGAAPALVS